MDGTVPSHVHEPDEVSAVPSTDPPEAVLDLALPVPLVFFEDGVVEDLCMEFIDLRVPEGTAPRVRDGHVANPLGVRTSLRPVTEPGSSCSNVQLFGSRSVRQRIDGRRVSEPAALQALVANLADELRLERDPLGVSSGAPPARPARAAALAEARSADEGLERLAELASLFRAERRRVTDVLQRSLVVVQTKEQASHSIAVALQAITTDHAVGGSMVFHLDHDALALDVALRRSLGDDAVLPDAVDVFEPTACDVGIVRPRREDQRGSRMKPRRSIGSELAAEPVDQGLELRAPLVGGEWSEVVAVAFQEVERDERRGDLAGELVDARRRRVEAQLQRLEVHRAVHDHEDLAVHDVDRWRLGTEQFHELGEVASKRSIAARVDADPVYVACDDRAEPVPLRFVSPALAERKLLLGLREHRTDRRCGHPLFDRSRSTRRRRRIFPDSDRGISSMNSTRRTFL